MWVTGPAGVYSAAQVENAGLRVNFASSSFVTSFDLVALGQRFTRVAEGYVSPDGIFGNPSQFIAPSNMLVQGALAGNASPAAAYTFQSRLDPNSVAYGVVFWKH